MKQHGLTLIEVLVASVILFMALGVAAVIFQHHSLAQLQASRYLTLAELNPSVMATVEFELNQGQTEGEFQLGQHEFSWRTSSSHTKHIIGSFDEGSGGFSTNAGQVALHDVEVKHESSDYHYQFQVLVWLDSQD